MWMPPSRLPLGGARPHVLLTGYAVRAPLAPYSGRACRPRPVLARAQAAAALSVTEAGSATLQGVTRRQNEDRFSLDLSAQVAPVPYAAVFDGHGGNACAEYLANDGLAGFIAAKWQGGASPEAAITQAFLAADRKVLRPKPGMFGMLGERGIGGSKCGATAVVALIFKDASDRQMLLTANVGDARVILGQRGGNAVQLTEDHVPDSEKERMRIEGQNPNKKMPLVRFVGGTWRVGGLLALSRAFGDAYLKGTGQFEGVQAGSDGYSSGFGVIAEPFVTLRELTPEDTWVVLASDGLNGNPERGGGGGLDNDEVIRMCVKLAKRSCDEIAQALAAAAVEAGSTDDVTVVVLRLA